MVSIIQKIIRLYGVRRGVILGKNVHVGPFSILSSPGELVIGDSTYIGKFCTIQVSGSIGNGVLIANNVGIVGRIDHEYRVPGCPIRNGSWVGNDPALADLPENKVKIDDDVWIGFGSIILSGLRVGEGAIIAAGSLVTKNVSPYAIVAGVPAVKVGMRFDGEVEAIATHQAALKKIYSSSR